MNTTKIIFIQKCCLFIAGMLISFSGFSNAHVNMSLKNISVTANTIEYDLYVVNDGASTLYLAGCSYGINIDPLVLNGGKIICSFKPNSRNVFLDEGRKCSVSQSNELNFVQARMTTGFSPREKSNELLPGVAFKIGRFVITNSKEWTINGHANLVLQEAATQSATACYLMGFTDGETQVKMLTAALGTLSTEASYCPVLNPSKSGGNAQGGNSRIKENDLLTNPVNTVNLYPNPATEKLHVDYIASSKGKLNIRIIDLHGRMMFSSSAEVGEGSNLVTVPVRDLVQGLYFIQISDQEQFSFQQAFTKQ
jgi:archaellum component FlaG (FlaF/FlaG flagellin family)